MIAAAIFTILTTFFCLFDIIRCSELAIIRQTLFIIKMLPIYLMEDKSNAFGLVIKILINYA